MPTLGRSAAFVVVMLNPHVRVLLGPVLEMDSIRGTPEDLRAVGADIVAHVAMVLVVVVRSAAADAAARGSIDAEAAVLVDSCIGEGTLLVSRGSTAWVCE